MPDDFDDKPEIPALPPVRLKNGRINPEHYRVRLAELNDIARQALHGGPRPKINLESYRRNIMAEAESIGLTKADIDDHRSPEDKIRDSVERLLNAPAAIWSERDEEIRLILEEVSTIADRGVAVENEWLGLTAEKILGQKIMERYADEEKPPDEEEKRKLEASRWCIRLRRVLRIRHMVREPVPKKAIDAFPSTQIPKPLNEKDVLNPSREQLERAWAGTHLLRVMKYVPRSDMDLRKKKEAETPADRLMKIGTMHVKMSMGIYYSEHSMYPNYRDHVVDMDVPYCDQGILMIGPPGHSKTTVATVWAAMRLYKNPRDQGFYLHAVDDTATENVSKIISYFDPTTETGQRMRSLFPGVEKNKKGTNNSELRLKSGDRTTSPNLYAAGVMSAGLGKNANFGIFDDIVKQSDAREPEERQRRCEQVGSTWMSRLRGEKAYRFIISNSWHYDDAVMRLKADAQKNRYFVIEFGVGGPNTNPPFRAIWPEVMPASELKRRYNELRNPALWSAGWMGMPQSDELRIITRLRYYDPSGEDMVNFLRTATFHLSTDPAASNREDACYAGIVYAGCGDVQIAGGSTGSVHYERRLRFIDLEQIHATQAELISRAKMMAMQRRIDRVHIETKIAFVAVAEQLEAVVGADCIVRHDPINKSKEIRLRSAAPALDDHAASMGGFRAVVEFPGVKREDGTIGPDPKYEWAYKQILDFPAAADRDVLDAVTQLVNHLIYMGDLNVGGDGAFSRSVMQEERIKHDPAVVRAVKDAISRDTREEKNPPGVFEWNFLHNTAVMLN